MTAVVKSPLFPVTQDAPLRFNGVDGATGKYLHPAMDPGTLARYVAGDELGATLLTELAARRTRGGKGGEAAKAPVAGVDPRRLDEAGWGVVFPAGRDSPQRDALAELLDRRRDQANGGGRELYKELTGAAGYVEGESKVEFLARHGLGPGPVDPARLPYYLLLVGGPEEIPFELQYQLGVQFAVGRLHFDTPEEYASYARTVVEAETRGTVRPRRIGCFGGENPGDDVSRRVVGELVEPIARRFADTPGWEVRSRLREDGSKANLSRLLGGEETPALLLTGTHGMGFPAEDPHQRERQGALLCSDWPGPDAWTGPIPAEHYFSAADIDADADLLGLVVLLFACYSAGMPRRDDFIYRPRDERRILAPRSALARLPQRLLGHPRGGALAVVGHVERAWSWSFHWHDTGVPQILSFESVFQRLIEGYPIGAALEYLSQRYAELATDFEEERRRWTDGRRNDPLMLSRLWTACQDARNYVLLGDPAVRLAAGSTSS
jgi:hypothetical protein